MLSGALFWHTPSSSTICSQCHEEATTDGDRRGVGKGRLWESKDNNGVRRNCGRDSGRKMVLDNGKLRE